MKMNKSLCAVSLVAVMACGAAHADLASTKYVDDKIEPIESNITNLSTNVTDLTTRVDALSGDGNDAAATKADIADMQVKSNMETSTSSLNDKLERTDLYPSMATANQMIKNANSSLSTKLQNEINERKEAVSDIQDSIDSVAEQVSAINGSLSNDYALKSSVATLEDRVTANAGEITTLKGGDTVSGSVANTVKTKIDDLDVAATTGTGVISSISQTDGKVAASYKQISNADIADNAAIAKTKLDSEVQESLVKANSAVQPSAIENMQTTTNMSATATAVADSTGANKDTKYPTVGAAAAIAAAAVANANQAVSDLTAQVSTNTSEIDTLKTAKQNKLTPGANITIASDGTISATDTDTVTTVDIAPGNGNVVSAITAKNGALTVTKGITAIVKPASDASVTTGKLVLTYDPQTQEYAWEAIGR